MDGHQEDTRLRAVSVTTGRLLRDPTCVGTQRGQVRRDGEWGQGAGGWGWDVVFPRGQSVPFAGWRVWGWRVVMYNRVSALDMIKLCR